MSTNPFGKTEPCFNCPFRRGKQAVRIRPERAGEIADNMLSTAGGQFSCHKTRGMGKDEEVHCAGALIFAEKNENATQSMRLAERLGLYDANELRKAEAWDEVFETAEEMIEANQDWFRKG